MIVQRRPRMRKSFFSVQFVATFISQKKRKKVPQWISIFIHSSGGKSTRDEMVSVYETLIEKDEEEMT